MYEQQRQQIAQAQLEELERTEGNEEEPEEGCDTGELPAWTGSRIVPDPDDELAGQVIENQQPESHTPGQTSILDLASGGFTYLRDHISIFQYYSNCLIIPHL